MRLAHRVLRNAGCAPPGIEERKDIDVEFDDARRQLPRSWAILQSALGTENQRSAQPVGKRP